MNDLLTSQKHAVDTIRPPAWADADDMAVTAMRRVRRRRTVIRVAGGAAAVLAVVGGVALAQPRPEPSLPGSSVPAAPVAQPVASPGPDVPDGWSAYEFGGLTFAVPSDWTKSPWAGSNREPGIAWWDETVTEQLYLAVYAPPVPDWIDPSLEGDAVEEWNVPGAEGMTVLRYEEGGLGMSANFEITRADGYVYQGNVHAPTEEARDAILDGLRETLAVSADPADVEALYGSTDDLPVVELPSGLPDGWRVQEVEGLEFGIPEGGEYSGPHTDADGLTESMWYDAGKHEIWFTHWPESHDDLAAPDADSGVKTFPLDGADYVTFGSAADEDGSRETVIVVRRAEGGVYQVRVVAPKEEGIELARQVAGTLALR